MDYFRINLDFTAPFRFGDGGTKSGLDSSSMICHSDTLLSAIIDEGCKLQGSDFAAFIADQVEEGNLIVSNLMPYDAGEGCLIPKPVMTFERKISEEKSQAPSLKKELKKLEFLPVKKVDDFISKIKQGTLDQFTFGMENVCVEQIFQRVAINGHDETQPYFVAAQHINSDKFSMYFILAANDGLEEWLNPIIDSLSFSGIGGKRNSGFGKFTWSVAKLEKGDSLYERLTKDYPAYLAISCVLPSKDEIDVLKEKGSFYTLIQRGGFAYSAALEGTPRKKKNIAMIKPGSVFPRKLNGKIVDLAVSGMAHNIYRNGKGLFIGVEI